MIGRCSICSSPQASEVDAAIRAGESQRSVARRFGAARTTLRRHAAHLLDEHAAPKPTLTDPDAGRRALAVLDECLELVERAESAGRAPEILGALRGARAAARSLVQPSTGPASDRDRAVAESLYERAVRLYSRVEGMPRLEQAAMGTMRGLLADVRKIAEHDDEGEVLIQVVHSDGTPTGPGMLVPRSALGDWNGEPIKLSFPGQRSALGPLDPIDAKPTNGNGHGDA